MQSKGDLGSRIGEVVPGQSTAGPKRVRSSRNRNFSEVVDRVRGTKIGRMFKVLKSKVIGRVYVIWW